MGCCSSAWTQISCLKHLLSDWGQQRFIGMMHLSIVWCLNGSSCYQLYGLLLAAGKPLSEAATKARLTCLTVLDAAAATLGKKSHANKAAVAKEKPKQGKEVAAGEKKQATGQKRSQEPRLPKAEVAAKGVAHDGVVEFPDVGEAGKKGKRRKKAKSNQQKSPAGQLKGVASRKFGGQKTQKLDGVVVRTKRQQR